MGPLKKLDRWQVLAGWCVLVVLIPGGASAWQMKQAPLMTRWAALVDTNQPLPEYPRPQLVRADWLNLDGIWQFQAGATNDPVPSGQTLSNEILVPYPMESAISGVMQYHEFSWYRRTFSVPAAWSGRRIILHLDAVDWQAAVYVNGLAVGVHKGGYDPIDYDITPYLNGAGAQELIVQVYSPQDNGSQPRGKQTLHPGGIMYTSSSGIWQPVWLEPVDAYGISGLHIVPDVDHSQVRLSVDTYATNGVSLLATVLSNGIPIGSLGGAPQSELDIPVPNAELWSPENPFLYGLQIVATHNGATNDTVTSYFGMRKISIATVHGVPEICLNNRPYFQMGPLDQGFWPDGLYTAPTDAALRYDLEMEKALGFNMVRKHIKVERQRWYYWADKLGLLVWQDMPSCNSYTGNPAPPPVDAHQFIAELSRMVESHWNSPAIIQWDIFNESQGQENTAGGVGQTNTAYLAQLVKSLDPSRLVNQASGGAYYGVGDVLDNHSYPAPGDPASATQAPVDGEYGGIGFQPAGHLWNPALAGGNYVGASTTNDIASIYDSFADDLVYDKSSAGLNAAVYTQITDVENECNGLLTYDRVLKPDADLIRASNQKAISAYIELSTVLATSQSAGRTWAYTTNTPPPDWYEAGFDDSGWARGPAGFGTAGTPGAVVRTTWNSPDIWLRQTFSVGALTPMDRARLVFQLYHDESCEIYLNGIQAGSATGYATSYVTTPLNDAGRNALVTNGTNLIAVHCHQTAGGQDIDVGICRQNLIMDLAEVPTDCAGHWTLDETNGSVAADSSGNGNDGTVSGAAWANSGKVNGCLNFNGVGSYVRLTNSIPGDFSICFWVRTTQSGGAGQWWQGRGLVDGFVAAGTNDFGTALSGGRFAFGAGNPDVPIVSTTPINDGTWHFCAATREQATGMLHLYVDGRLEASAQGSTNGLTAAGGLRLGSLQTGANFFNGSLDDVEVFNRALGSNEVAALYWSGAAAAPPPGSLRAVAGDGQVRLGWSAVPGATGYDLKRSTNAAGPYRSISTLYDTNYTDAAVANGTTYYYMVAAMNSLGDGTNSPAVNATPSLARALKAWFKADALTGLADNAAVSNWPDISGNGCDATQPNAGCRPVYVSNALHGLPVVRFNAAGSNELVFARPVQGDFTVLCVFQSTQGFGSGNLFYQGAGLVSGEEPGVTSDFGTCLFSNGQLCAGTGNPDVAVNSPPGFNDGRPHLITFKRLESTGEADLYVDGAFEGGAIGNTGPLDAPVQLALGAQQTRTFFFSGDIAEVKIYGSALSDSDRGAEEGELECKYGIAGIGAAPATPPGLAGTPANRSISLSWSGSAGADGYNLGWSTNAGGPFAPLITNLAATTYLDARALSGRTNYYVIAATDLCRVSPDSEPISVFLPAPGLVATAGRQTVTLSWPSWASDWELLFATNLAWPVNWYPVTNPVDSNNAWFNVSIPAGSGPGFFRLAAP